ncbi:MAG: 16S rRNA (guanine(527)-N(7))-methyltransferase RsmG, partial [Candidatus Eisenbacteria bacterium]|nr:16S rRNA (guanine(527)-N(7))-methyltransferase RsmG [Candidatus Eisenbacteria bacterium]
MSVVSSHGLALDPRAVERLAVYCAELTRAAHRMNLVSRSDLEDIVSKHVAPSLGIGLVEEPDAKRTWIDVGTGGGFPGMVLKSVYPNCRMTLLDASRKKTEFLRRVASRLALEDLRVVRARVESLAAASQLDPSPEMLGPRGAEPLPPAAFRGAFDRITMRAVTSLRQTFPWIDQIASDHCRLYTFKGPAWRDELAEADAVLRSSNWSLRTVQEIPWARPRILVFGRHDD